MFGIFTALQSLGLIRITDDHAVVGSGSAEAGSGPSASRAGTDTEGQGGGGAGKLTRRKTQPLGTTERVNLVYLQSCEEAAGHDDGEKSKKLIKVCYKFRRAFGHHLVKPSGGSFVDLTKLLLGYDQQPGGGERQLNKLPFIRSPGSPVGRRAAGEFQVGPPSRDLLGQHVGSRPFRRYVCFEKLVLAGRNNVFDASELNSGKTSLLHQFRSSLLRHHGLNPDFQPSKPQIVVLEKKGKRGVQNFAEISTVLQSRRRAVLGFGDQAPGEKSEKETQRKGVDTAAALETPATVASEAGTVCKTSWRQPSFQDQLKVLLQTTLLVTPSGGISTILPLLPKNSFVLLLTYQPQRDFWKAPISYLSSVFFYPPQSVADLSEEQADIAAEMAGAENFLNLKHPSSEPPPNGFWLRLWRFVQDYVRFGRHRGECPGCPNVMEDELWQHVPWVRKVHYQAFEDKDFEGSDPGRNAAVKLQPGRLVNLIRIAVRSWRALSETAGS
eukprot:g448.t1